MDIAQNAVSIKLSAIRDRRKRWQTRLTRASNMLAKLNRQEARLIKPAKSRPAETKPPVKPEPETDTTDLAIPPELKRADEKPQLLKGEMPKLLGELLDPASVVNRMRLEKMDRKRRGPSKIDKTSMPLSGRDALTAIKRKT